MPELERLNLLRPSSRSSLVAYCESWAILVTATEFVREHGLTVLNRSVRKDGTKLTWVAANPAVSIARAAQRELRSWAAEFGLTPSAEGRLNLEAIPRPDDDDDVLLD